MDYRQIIRSQYLATLEMLKQAIEKCPDAIWDDPADKNRFWHVAYHALFYTHLYLQPSEQDFRPWAKQRKAHDLSETADPYSKETISLLLDCASRPHHPIGGVSPKFHTLSFFRLLLADFLETPRRGFPHTKAHPSFPTHYSSLITCLACRFLRNSSHLRYPRNLREILLLCVFARNSS